MLVPSRASNASGRDVSAFTLIVVCRLTQDSAQALAGSPEDFPPADTLILLMIPHDVDEGRVSVPALLAPFHVGLEEVEVDEGWEKVHCHCWEKVDEDWEKVEGNEEPRAAGAF